MLGSKELSLKQEIMQILMDKAPPNMILNPETHQFIALNSDAAQELINSYLNLPDIEDPYLIERELARAILYKNIVTWAAQVIKKPLKEVRSLLLRYIFNLIITRRTSDDPVFITGPSELADRQILSDFKYYKLKLNPEQFLMELKNHFKDAAQSLKLLRLPMDQIPSLDAQGRIHYHELPPYFDINQLGLNYPQDLNYVLAINIRYNYLHLDSHGLANLYYKKYSKSAGTEAFASVFNHYFNIFCTAFPDLESRFGSIGSFFEIKKWTTRKVFVNPPFDETLINKMADKVLSDLEQDHEPRQFILTLPHWRDMTVLTRLKQSRWIKSIREYKKGQLPFMNYMTNKIIYPVDIIEIILSNY